jgi:monofunctional biosynthetic peptidoglycan transglycosylase
MPFSIRFRRRAARLAMLALVGTVLVLIAYQVWLFAHVLWWSRYDPDSTRFMDIRLAELRIARPSAELSQRWVPYNRISSHLKRAIIAAEDAKFVDHEGFDWEGIQRALEKNQRRGRAVAGGSTISQQLAKNLFLTPRRSYWRKAEEALITLMIEAVMDKRRILEIYLNVVEWGNGVFGAEAAARHYFGVSAASLDAWQAAWLAGALPNPRFYDRRREAPGLARKTAIILDRMPDVAIP